MNVKNLSLRLRIFLSMIFLVFVPSVIIVVTSIYQYKEEAQEYHRERLERKEGTVKDQINYEISQKTTYPVTTKNIPLIFKWGNFIYELADVHKLELKLYDLEGNFLISSSEPSVQPDIKKPEPKVDAEILKALAESIDKRHITTTKSEGKIVQSSYTYITDPQFKPLAILNLPYIQDNEFITRELNEFLERLAFVYSIILVIAIALAYFLSKYITKSLKTISDKMKQTRLDKRNTKIEINDLSEEISALINSYNSMIDELEESAVKLARSEREQAWREMAKQVAHEIKNPLTPMRLSVQSFQRKFDPEDENVHQKINEFSKTLIQQIDTMSSIASAFSNFADMPAQQNETLNVVEIVRLALDIFNEDAISFHAEQDSIISLFDRTQLIRVVTNLVKNAIQSKDKDRPLTVFVSVKEEDNNVHIIVADNGIGIKDINKPKIFEPKFTTKTSGMGLGLAMIKNIIETNKGNITFTSQENKGTVFTVTLPKY